MPRRPAVASVRRIAVATALVAGALVGSRPAAAAEAPTGANFDIWYYTTNETAERGRLFGSTDLTSFVNQARCQCNHAISTRVLLKRAMTSYDPSVRVQSFVGSRCDIGQTNSAVFQLGLAWVFYVIFYFQNTQHTEHDTSKV